jgi:hypothetical protein
MTERTAFPEPYPADGGVLAQVDWWFAYGPMFFAVTIAAGVRVLAARIASSIRREGDA